MGSICTLFHLYRVSGASVTGAGHTRTGAGAPRKHAHRDLSTITGSLLPHDRSLLPRKYGVTLARYGRVSVTPCQKFFEVSFLALVYSQSTSSEYKYC